MLETPGRFRPNVLTESKQKSCVIDTLYIHQNISLSCNLLISSVTNLRLVFTRYYKYKSLRLVFLPRYFHLHYRTKKVIYNNKNNTCYLYRAFPGAQSALQASKEEQMYGLPDTA